MSDRWLPWCHDCLVPLPLWRQLHEHADAGHKVRFGHPREYVRGGPRS